MGVRCTVVVLTCFAMFEFVYVGVLQCLGVLEICVLVFTVFFVLFLLCIFILICFVCTSVRTSATE